MNLDTSLVALAYVILCVAAVASVAAVLGLVVAVRELRRPPGDAVRSAAPASAAAPRELSRAA